MNFKLIRGFSIKGLELNTKEIISPKLEKKNLLKKKSTYLIKKNNSNLKQKIKQKNYLDIIKDKENEIELLKKELITLRNLVNNNNSKNKDKDKTNEKISSKNSIIVNKNRNKEKEKIGSFDINNSENNEKASFGSFHSPKNSSMINNNTLSFSYSHKGKYNSPYNKKTKFSKLNLHNIIKKKSLSKDIHKNYNNNKNKSKNLNEKDSKFIFENILERTKSLFDKLKK